MNPENTMKPFFTTGRGIQSNVRSIIYGQGIHMQILKMQLHLSEEYGTKTALKFPVISKMCFSGIFTGGLNKQYR